MGKTPSYSDSGDLVAFVVSLWPEQVSQALWVALKAPRILPSCVGVLYGMSFCPGPVSTLPPSWLVTHQHSQTSAPVKAQEPGQ